jgi:hypothetical protein
LADTKLKSFGVIAMPKKIRNIFVILVAFVVVAGFEIDLEGFALPNREQVAALVDTLAGEYRTQFAFDLDELLATFDFERDDFVQYIYRGAHNLEIALDFWFHYGVDWPVAMIEYTFLDLMDLIAEHEEDLVGIVLAGIFEWAWSIEWIEVQAFAGEEDFGARFAMELTGPVAGIIFTEITNASLNLFVQNDSDQTLQFVFQTGNLDEFGGQIVHFYHEVEIAPGGNFVMQLPPETVAGNLIGFYIMGEESAEIAGELAFRFTNLPLGYE